jgi:hypothetical protein
MPASPESRLGRLASASRIRPALIHITAPRRLARFLIAAGAQDASARPPEPGEPP